MYLHHCFQRELIEQLIHFWKLIVGYGRIDLNRLLVALGIGLVETSDKTSNFTGEELLLACLYRLSNKTLHEVSQLFGRREYS